MINLLVFLNFLLPLPYSITHLLCVIKETSNLILVAATILFLDSLVCTTWLLDFVHLPVRPDPMKMSDIFTSYSSRHFFVIMLVSFIWLKIINLTYIPWIVSHLVNMILWLLFYYFNTLVIILLLLNEAYCLFDKLNHRFTMTNYGCVITTYRFFVSNSRVFIRPWLCQKYDSDTNC